MSQDAAPDAPPAKVKKPWRGREPDALDRAVLAHLHAARALIAPQLQLLYGLASPGSLQPRLVGLLGPNGTPRYLERAKAPDGRYVYALGPQGYDLLPGSTGEVPRHKPLGRLRISAQWLDHTLAVGWLQTTWLLGGRTLLDAGGHVAWWGERQATLRYPLRRPKEHVTHGRIEPDGAAVLQRADGQRWVGAIEHDQGTESAEQWAAKLERWAAVIRCGAWEALCGDVAPYLLVTVPGPARLHQLAPWLAAGRHAHGSFWVWIAVHPDAALVEGEGRALAAARLTTPVWRLVQAGRQLPAEETLAATAWSLRGIVGATAPWRPRPAVATPPPAPAALVLPARAPATRPDAEPPGVARLYQAELDAAREVQRKLQAELDEMDRNHRMLHQRAFQAEEFANVYYAYYHSQRVRQWHQRWLAWLAAGSYGLKALGLVGGLLAGGALGLLACGLLAAFGETWRAADPTLAAAWATNVLAAWWYVLTQRWVLILLGVVSVGSAVGLLAWPEAPDVRLDARFVRAFGAELPPEPPTKG